MARRENDPAAAIWATLTVVALPVVSSTLAALGMAAVWSFVLGMFASLLVLLIEGAVRGRWWIMEPAISDVLSHPHLTWRLLVFVGVLMLLFLTFLMTVFLTNPSLDRGFVHFILTRHCTAPEDSYFASLCRAQSTPRKSSVDAIDLALRTEAAKRFFPDTTLVSCASFPVAQMIEPETCTHAAMVRCDAWQLSRVLHSPTRLQTVTATVVSRLRVQRDGTYAVEAWSDTPQSVEWNEIGLDISDTAMTKLDKIDQDAVETMLAEESFRRVMESLSAE